MKAKSVQSINPPPVAGQACQSVIQTIYDIVKAHGGTIEVKSLPAVDKETEFVLHLPTTIE